MLGCLIIHGFTSCADSVNRVAVRMNAHAIPWRMPLLRGHGTRPEDLLGVTWHDWYADAAAALDDLRREVEQVVIVGLSMGGLVGLHLAAARATDVAGIVTVAAALRFQDERIYRLRHVAPWRPMLGDENRDMGYGWADPELGRRHNNYRRFATGAAASLGRYATLVEQQLQRVHAPILIIHSHRDRTIKPEAARIIYKKVGSTEKELVWFERSGHEMLRDVEAPAVLDCIEAFVLRRQTLPTRK